MGADRSWTGIRANCGGRVSLHEKNRQAGRRCQQRVGGGGGSGHEAREERAGGRSGQRRRRAGRDQGCQLRCHGAVMRTMAAAAGWQTHVVAGFEHPRQGAQPEEQNQKNRDPAPHPILMVHELCSSSHRRPLPLPVRCCWSIIPARYFRHLSSMQSVSRSR